MNHDTDPSLRAFVELSSQRVSDGDVPATLARIGDLAVIGIEGCDSASVSMFEGEAVTAAVFTSDLAEQGDAAQYAAGEGPCLSALAERRAIAIDSFTDDARWPAFRLRAAGLGIGAVVSMPLVSDGLRGTLNLYSGTVGGFPLTERPNASLFAEQAAVAIANAQAFHVASQLVEQMQAALASRAVIEQAKGILMEREACDADQAFELLRSTSQRMNRKLREIAEDLVDSVVHPTGAGSNG